MSSPLPLENSGSVARAAGLSETGFGLSDLQQRYRVLAKLGSGGMADVFLAMQVGAEDFSRLAVIKRMRAMPDAREESARMFFNEARVVASLNHPHIVKVFDLGWVNKDIAMAMEYLDGESLHYVHVEAKKRNQHIPLPVILKLVSEAAEALHYAHSASASNGRPLHLIHRDVGLQNLLLTRTGYLKIIDFGVAKSSTQVDVTTPGLVKGKIRYFAPETLTRNDVDGRADLYALGLVLFELVTLDQAHPFASDATLAEVYERITTHVLPPVTAVRDDLPIALNEVIRRATKIDRDERFQTGVELAEALREVARPLGGFASTAEVERWFQETFAERFEQRRQFETKAMARLDRVGPLVDDDTQFEHEPQRSGDPIGEVVKSDPVVVEAMPSTRTGPVRWVLGAALVFVLFFTASFVIRASMNEPAAVTPKRAAPARSNLLVTSTPPGAEVFIDGETRGRTSAAGASLRIEPGVEHDLLIRLEGYYDYRISVVGESFGQRLIDAHLFVEPEATPQVASLARDDPRPRRKGRRGREAENEQLGRTTKTRAGRESRPATDGDLGTEPRTERREARRRERRAERAPTSESLGNEPVDAPKRSVETAPLPPPPPPPPVDEARRDPVMPPRGPVTQSSAQLMSRRLSGKAPRYPRRELERQLEGTVTAHVQLDRDGRMRSFEFTDGSPAFKRAVRDVLSSWTFRPHEVEGIPVETRGTLEIEFRLGP